MENNISNSDKTDEVHIEEYDKTDSIQSDEYGFDDIENEAPEDVDFDDELESDELETAPGIKAQKENKSITGIISKQLPALANIMDRFKKNKNTSNDKTKVDNDISDGDDDDPENSGDKPKPKFKLTPIHIIVILGLGVFLFIGDDEPEFTAKPLKPIRKNIPKKEVAPTAENQNPTEVAANEEVAQDIAEEVGAPTGETDLGEGEDSMSDIRMENTPDEAVKSEESSTLPEVSDVDLEPAKEVSEEIMNDVDLDIDKVQRVDVISTTPDQVDEASIVDNRGEEVSEVEQTPDTQPGFEEEILPQKIVDPELSTDMTKKLLENLQVKLKEERTEQVIEEQLMPTGSPSYESPGSGLVYNCKGGHWACIDADEYKKCRQNYSWNKSESIPIECYPMAYLNTDFDCATVQQEKVNSVPDLKFCE